MTAAALLSAAQPAPEVLGWELLASALLAAAAVALWCGAPAPALVRRRLGISGGRGPGPTRRNRLRTGRRHAGRGPVVLAATAGGGTLALTGMSGSLLAVSAALLAGAAAWLRALSRRRARSDAVRRQVTEACDALVAELRAGQPPARALGRVAEDYPALRAAARACALGGDVPAALRSSSELPAPGARRRAAPGGLPALAAAWQVADECGSGLVATLDRVADGLRAEEATCAEVASALAPARATARLLAVLPAFGLLLGSGLGGDPVGMLLGSPGGHGLLLAGVALSLGGTAWVERIAEGVRGP